MSLTSRLTRGLQRTAPAQNRAMNGNPAGDTLFTVSSYLSANTDAGKRVTVDSAMHLSSVYAALRVISDAVGSLPLMVYQRKAAKNGGGRVKAWFDPAYRLLHDQPNPEMTSVECWSLVATHLNAWGNAYIGKTFKRDSRGVLRLAELWPIRPDLVRVARIDGTKVFYVRTINGLENPTPYTAADIIHIRGLSLDGLIGLSPLELAQQAIGRGLAVDEFGNKFFSNGARPGGVISVQGQISPEGAKRVQADWERLHRGSQNAHRVAVLEEGAKFEPVTVPLGDAQFVQQQEFTVTEIARIFRIPPSMIGGTTGDSMTYKTVEGDNQAFLNHSLRPWLARIEQALINDPDIFPSTSVFCEFLVDGLLRADSLRRAQFYQIALDPQRGWMKPSEVRELENLPPDDTFDTRPVLPAGPPAPTPTQDGAPPNA